MRAGTVRCMTRTGENSYKRTFMGYYILDSGSGDQVTSTVVEEERSVVIILNPTGYRMEHFQGQPARPAARSSHRALPKPGWRKPQ
jgi:hypothetical protein